MTQTDSLTVIPDVADLARTARLLARQVEAFGLASEQNAGADSADSSLWRLFRGEGLPGDEALIGMPLEGSRVLHVNCADATPAATDRIRSVLDRAAGCIFVRQGRDAWGALVRHVPRRAGEDRGLLAARRLAAEVIATDRRVMTGISTAVENANHLPTAVGDAADAAALAAEHGVAMLEVEHVWADLVWRRARRILVGSLPTAVPIRRLLEHDLRNGTDFARTVSVWLDSNQDAQSAATQLCIHSNTLRYRLRRASTLVGLDLTDPKQRLIAHLVLS